MLNYIWAGMILLGVIYGVCTGQMSALTGGALDSAREAVSLCITMAGVMALWMGLMEIAQESGMIAKMTKGIRPFLKFMFPRLPEDHPAGEYITTNLIANVLGLGWACTPAGLKAMEQLAELEKQRAEQRRIEQQRMQPVNRQLRPVAGQGDGEGTAGIGGSAVWSRGHGSQQRDVHLPDSEYFILTADPSQHDRLPQSVRQCQPRGDHCSGAGGHTVQYDHCHHLL